MPLSGGEVRVRVLSGGGGHQIPHFLAAVALRGLLSPGGVDRQLRDDDFAPVGPEPNMWFLGATGRLYHYWQAAREGDTPRRSIVLSPSRTQAGGLPALAVGSSFPLESLENSFWIQEAEDQLPDGGDLDEYLLLCGVHKRERGGWRQGV